MTVRRMPGQRPEGVDLLPSELVRESSAHSDDLARERLCCTTAIAAMGHTQTVDWVARPRSRIVLERVWV